MLSLNKSKYKKLYIGLVIVIGLVFFITKDSNENLQYTICTTIDDQLKEHIKKELIKYDYSYKFSKNINNKLFTLKSTKEQINSIKLMLLMNYIPTKGTSCSFFDKSTLGTKAFKNKDQYLQALENALSNTFIFLPEIINAKIIINYNNTDFNVNVVLTLSNNICLGPIQQENIKYFIASSLPKLKPNDVILTIKNNKNK